MNQRKLQFNYYGLQKRFAINMLGAAAICVLLFFALYYSSEYLLTDYFVQSDFEETRIEKQGKSLQAYVDKNDISSKDLKKLKKWEMRQPVILLEVFAGNECIYSSFYDDSEDRSLSDYESQNNEVEIQLSDKRVTVLLYSDFTYQYYVIRTAISVLLSFAVFIILFMRNNQKLIRYICRLNDEVQILEGGNLEYQVSVEGNDELTDLARSMNRMRVSFLQQIESEQELFHANRQLVTEMSHDLRTPLTGIMLYLEILRSHRYSTEEELQSYLEKIDAKAHHMKLISDHLFEYTMKESHEKQMEPILMEQAFSKSLRSLKDDLKAHGFRASVEAEWTSGFVQVNEEYIQRIFENILSNIVKYADSSAEIFINVIDMNQYSGISVMNMNASDANAEESNGIGIESIQSMMQKMNGRCMVEQTDTLFEITLLFPKL